MDDNDNQSERPTGRALLQILAKHQVTGRGNAPINNRTVCQPSIWVRIAQMQQESGNPLYHSVNLPHLEQQPSTLPAPTPLTSIATLGPIIRNARKAMRMTQAQFAAHAGVGRRFVSELEGGKPSLEFDKVLACCAAAGIDIIAKPRG